METLNEKHTRLMATHDNITRTHGEKMKQAREYALSKFLEQLVPVVDAMESGLAHMPETDDKDLKALSQGIDMTHKMLIKLLEEHGLSSVNPENEIFNDKFHEAISTQQDAEYDHNLILQVVQKGYLLKERLIRPARVIINQNENIES